MATTKVKTHALNHTAGIFSDMSVDGPIIGTLVVVVDRAKNLPNRKTIGKQDPYCAARLGKEAKKTTTDIRGGQVPRWDQELRFTVHDSPDYYQLKVSVFNDDKRTDLIGECWVDLRDIIIAGGGQNDLWHQLACKGKYAGEIRIEMTYYDSRPKPEKPVLKPKKSGTPDEDGASTNPSLSASGPRAMPKRRPLPSDPITGKAPSQPTVDHVKAPPVPRTQTNLDYIPTKSSLQQVDYKTAPPRPRQQPEHMSPGPISAHGGPSWRLHQSSQQPHLTPERAERHHEDRPYNHIYPAEQSFDYHLEPPDAPCSGERDVVPKDDRPPLPPAHRSRNNSGAATQVYQQNGYDHGVAKGTPPSMRHDVLRNEAHRCSLPAGNYPGRPAYKPQDSAPAALEHVHSSDPFQMPPPRHHSYEAASNAPYRSMQATVEDVPESPETLTYRGECLDVSSDYDPAPMPSSLMVGMDRALMQEMSPHRRRYTQPPAPIETPARRRTMDDLARHDTSVAPQYGPPQPNSRSPTGYSSGPTTPNNATLATNKPHQQHTISRKSLSPAPLPSRREVAGAPFGPDSYDAFNPSVVAAAQTDARSTVRVDYDYNEASGKIMTHDGREVDPSDHLPVETWAPEPEPKVGNGGKPASSGRFSGPKPAPRVVPSGRRTLKLLVHPNGSADTSPIQRPSHSGMSAEDKNTATVTATPTPPTGRNRLQKKSQPQMHQKTSTSLLNGGRGGPLAPMPSHQHNNHGNTQQRRPVSGGQYGRGGYDDHRGLVAESPRQAATSNNAGRYMGTEMENHAPYGSHALVTIPVSPSHGMGTAVFGSSPDSRGAVAPPMVPAKIPLALPPLMSGGRSGWDTWAGADELGYDDRSVGRIRGGGDGSLSLVEEMQRIDIGTGRARRHGHSGGGGGGGGA